MTSAAKKTTKKTTAKKTKLAPKPRVVPPTGFEHLYDKNAAVDTNTKAASTRVGVLTLEWGNGPDMRISRSSMEFAFRELAKAAGGLAKRLGPAWAIYLTPTYDEAREQEQTEPVEDIPGEPIPPVDKHVYPPPEPED